MKYKAGDEVLVKGAITDLHEGTDRPYFVAVNYDSVHWVSEDKFIPMDKTYVDGLNDAWELARKLYCEHNDSERREILGIAQYETVLECMTPEEALAKIEAYEKEKSEIKVGDVVVSRDTKRKFLVVTEEDDDSVYEFGVIDLKTLTLDRICNYPKGFTKTGKHIDIESLLKQIGE